MVNDAIDINITDIFVIIFICCSCSLPIAAVLFNLNEKYVNINIDDGLIREKVIEEICLHEIITKTYNELEKTA